MTIGLLDMTIETKYNIGDEVWFNLVFIDNRPSLGKGNIIGIRREAKDQKVEEVYDVYIEFYWGDTLWGTDIKRLTKEELFPTKEELSINYITQRNGGTNTLFSHLKKNC